MIEKIKISNNINDKIADFLFVFFYRKETVHGELDDPGDVSFYFDQMNFIGSAFNLLFSEFENSAFGDKFLFVFNDLINSEDFLWIIEMILEIDVKYFELEELFGFFWFSVNFQDLSILNVIFLEPFHVDLRVHRTDTLNKAKILFFNAIAFHDLLGGLVTDCCYVVGSF